MKGSGAIVLMYHRLGSGRLAGREPGEEIYAVTPETFSAQLEVLATSRCSVLSFEAAASAWLEGRKLPERTVTLTFDDGNASDHAEALPALARRGYQGAFFVSPALVGREGYVDWAQLRELADAGMTVGAHGLDHTLLSRLDDEGVRRQFRECRRLMQDRLGRSPDCMSLPGGAGGPRVVAIAREEGFRVIADSVPRRADPQRRAGTLPRFAVRRALDLDGFRSLVEHQPLTLLRSTVRHRALLGLRATVGEGLYQRVRKAWGGQIPSA
jgi:peptidoglycan/xylan/chitin deacetylase (PgdA/CDA1 family)